jgi:hypothetical protein
VREERALCLSLDEESVTVIWVLGTVWLQLRKQQAVYLARKKQQQFGWSQEMMLGQTLFDDDDDDDDVE